MKKFLHLGLAVEEVIAMSTIRPAEAIGRSPELGSITVGAVADISVLRIVEGRFTLHDTRGESRVANRRLEPVHTIRAGVLSEPTPWHGARG